MYRGKKVENERREKAVVANEIAPRLVVVLTAVLIHVHGRKTIYEELKKLFADTKAQQTEIILERRNEGVYNLKWTIVICENK